MPTFVVTYHYADVGDERRAQHRPDHVAFLHELHDAGTLYMSGPVVDDPPRAVLVVEADDRAALEKTMDADPFFARGLVGHRDIIEWKVVFDPRVRAQ